MYCAIYGIGLIVIRMREGYEDGVRERTESYCIECSMVCPVKRVSLSSSQFSETLLVTTRPCLLKNQIMPLVKLCPKIDLLVVKFSALWGQVQLPLGGKNH